MSGLGGVGNAGVFLTGMSSIHASGTGPRWRRTCLRFALTAPRTRVVDLTPVVRIRFAVRRVAVRRVGVRRVALRRVALRRVAVCRVAVRSIHC